ncbi:hypothetical protein Q7C_2538 [Methylophaga frappieri]|uniref:Uncharacterized protein n=1 Tax=Methylophaga frappieri (strain ATCC BAA-2434 / DSM 25690 / JAM7) TaxID=754477 RepID=I1YL66_METFJ|nr:hypothetical protein Q7C_2538 [Methylophaga frappieri]
MESDQNTEKTLPLRLNPTKASQDAFFISVNLLKVFIWSYCLFWLGIA